MVHVNCAAPERFAAFLELPYFKSLKEFQRQTLVFTSNDVVKKLKIDKDMEFRAKLKELFLSFPSESETLHMNHKDMMVTFKHMHEFAEKWDLDINSPHFPCGRECCKYGDVQL